MLRQLCNAIRFLQPAILSAQSNLTHRTINSSRNFSLLSCNHNAAITSCSTTTLLQPSSISLTIDRGMKQVGKVKRRCKDCFMLVRHERLYNYCKTHPRHKQMAMVKKPKNTWTLTDATQSKQRAW